MERLPSVFPFRNPLRFPSGFACRCSSWRVDLRACGNPFSFFGALLSPLLAHCWCVVWLATWGGLFRFLWCVVLHRALPSLSLCVVYAVMLFRLLLLWCLLVLPIISFSQFLRSVLEHLFRFVLCSLIWCLGGVTGSVTVGVTRSVTLGPTFLSLELRWVAGKCTNLKKVPK